MRARVDIQKHILLLFGVIFTSTPPCLAGKDVDLLLRVLDSRGDPVPRFEVMLHTHEHGYNQWATGTDGEIDFHYRPGGPPPLLTGSDPHFQVVVRAPELAPTILHLENTGSRMQETVRLTPGRLIELLVRTAGGDPPPESVDPAVVYEDFASRVRALRQPQNARRGLTIDFEMSKVERTGPGRYRFRVPIDPPPFRLVIHEPGFMRSLESATISEEDLSDNRIEWQLATPARLHIRFDASDGNDLPAYRQRRAQVLSRCPETGTYYTVWLDQSETLSFEKELPDLPPGRYMARVVLTPDEGQTPEEAPALRPFYHVVDMDLAAGEEKTLVLDYVPFEPDTWRGRATATVTVQRFDGRPAAGEAFTLSHVCTHYGGVTILEDKLDANGRFQLKNVAPGPDGPEFFLEVGDRWARGMQMTETGDQTFSFTLGPQVGDPVPEASLTDLATNRPVSLDSFRGNIVYLEFWATWCGPCQRPMAELNEIARQQAKAWAGRVQILAASIDDRRETVQAYVKQHGWTDVRHLWAGNESDASFQSKAAETFGLRGVPTAMLIDADGRIVWRGHPREADVETQIRRLLQ